MTGEVNMTKKLKNSKTQKLHLSTHLIIHSSNLLRDWKWTILIGLGIVTLFFILRLINLAILPIFADEAIYIRWAQVMRAEPTLRFLPLSDGKQPLFMWLTIPFLKLFTDPLVAGRMVSVFSGLGSLVGLFLTTYYLFKSKRAALLAILIYSFLPYALFLDRMALVDSMLLAFAIWTFFLASLLVEYQRIDLAILTGIVLGGGLITKSPAMFFIGLIPTTALLLPFKSKKDLRINILKLIGLWLIAYLFAFAIYNILRLGPEFQMIALRNKDYVFSIGEILSHPHDPILIHLKDISDWFPNLFTWPILVASFLGAVISLIDEKKRKICLILLAWFLAPLLIQSAVAKVFTPRYLLYTIFPLLIFAALFFEFLFNKFKRHRFIITFLILIIPILPLRYDYLLLTNPQAAPLPERMRTGYLEEWTSGYGINEVRDYLREVSQERHVNVGTEGYFGTLPDGLQIYFDKDPKVTVFGIGLSLLEVPEPLKESAAAGEAETFLVVNESRMGAKDDPLLELVLKIPKAEGKKGQDSLLLYRVK
jgi:4-amino-4-deoxy-L-arabinose transferase-like glycosyltransferase